MSNVFASWKKHTLRFRFEAGTSRGVLTTKDTWYISLSHQGAVGIGECGPLKGLSPDDRPDFEEKISGLCAKLNALSPSEIELQLQENTFDLHEFPSIHFGLETALLDLKKGGGKILFETNFTKGIEPISINGLVWMGDAAFMQKQLEEKLSQGYYCVKLKIGALDFYRELALIASIRKRFSPSEITIRVDANGAFSTEDAQEKLDLLASHGIHSIEQPIRQGQWAKMKELCTSCSLPIALDEELIGIHTTQKKIELLTYVHPQYIILKPTLLGGFRQCSEWIEIATSLNIGWWITSALESNIGLNAISQYTASLAPTMPQGLGTGQLYHNNIESPLTIERGNLYYDIEKKWDLSFFS